MTPPTQAVTLGNVGSKQDTDSKQDVVHEHEEQAASLKGVDFRNAHDFGRVLRDHALPNEPMRVNPPNAYCTRFVWANDDVLIATLCNPLTGEHGLPDVGRKPRGWASYIAISGRADAVEAVYDTIMAFQMSVEGADSDSRIFL